MNFFKFNDPDYEKHYFGFGQFVVLLTLAPFILSLGLFSMWDPSVYARSYILQPLDFELTGASEFPVMINGKPAKCAPLPQCLDAFRNAPMASQSTDPIFWGKINWSPGNLLMYGSGFLLYVPAVWLCFKRRQFGLLLFGLAIPNLYLIVILLKSVGFSSFGDLLERWVTIIAPKLAFLWFALRGRVFSVSFLLATALMLAGSALFQTDLLVKPFTFLMYTLVPVAVFVLCAALVRILVMAAIENSYFLQHLGPMRLLRAVGHSALLWIPMALLSIPYFKITETVPEEFKLGLYENKQLVLDPRTSDFRDNALLTTATRFDDLITAFNFSQEKRKLQSKRAGMQLTAAVISGADAATDASNQAVTDLNAQLNIVAGTKIKEPVLATFDDQIPLWLSFSSTDVDLMWPADKVANAAGDSTKDGINANYMSMRKKWRIDLAKKCEEAEARIQKEVAGLRTRVSDLRAKQASLQNSALAEQAALQKEVQALIQTTLTDSKNLSERILLLANHEVQDKIWWAIVYFRATHTFSFVLFALVCVKSFLYVFARVAFNKDTGTFISLGNAEGESQPVVESQITPTGSSYVIPGGQAETYYVSRKFQSRGKAPRFAIPQPLGGPIARILHGKVTMNKVVMQPSDKAVTYTATQGAQFLEWNLRDGEVVLFDFHHFVGMSEELKISTLISPRLSTLLLGKFIFSTATGPGKLILMTSGRAEITSSDQVADSLPPERLVAMPKDMRLYAESEMGPLDVYLSTAYVRPEAGGQLIVDVDSQRGSGVGLGRFFTHFIWPG